MRTRFSTRQLAALFFLLIMLADVLTPTVAYALTAGPTAPEATSFEPVDTTDMVNLATGDLTYNVPLLEVPGPAGGYPLSLSYHAGIQPNEDASWVGLGWTLGPGAISRIVNGYPDDQLGAIRTRRDYNHGGERNTFSVGIGVPGATFGLSISNDSNLGLGIGTSMSIGYGAGFGESGVGIGGNFVVGNDGYGNTFSGAYLGLSVGSAGSDAKGLSTNIGLSTNFKSVAFSGGVGWNSGENKHGRSSQTSLIGVSIASNGLRPSLTVAGYDALQTNGAAGKMTTESWGLSLPSIPVGPFTVTLGYNYTRYYSDETSNVNLIGTLNAPSTNGKSPDSWSFDSYALLDPDASGGIVKNSDPEKSKGGSFPAYDSYSVMAQGIGGSIQPYIFDNGTLFRQNVKTQDGSSYVVRYSGLGNTNSYGFSSPVFFRFKNDFSNSYSYENTQMTRFDDGSLQFDLHLSAINPAGFNANVKRLAGSKHIEYFTNSQIRSGFAKDKGFITAIPFSSTPISRNGFDISNQVGGFMITNESGVAYHFSQPAYTYDQYSKTFKTGKENEIFMENTDRHPYAYAWLLSAVTGPDFVSRNSLSDGTISKEDWGYWVKFVYMQQSPSFIWRNPVAGTHNDVDSDVEMYSYGKKEIFYLDRIETKSHIALLEKSERADGRGVANPVSGNFSPQIIQECWRDRNSNANVPPLICNDVAVNSAKTLKLDRVMLFTRANVESGNAQEGFAIRVVSFSTDYSLCPGTLNSFNDSNINTKLGKLTLKAIAFKGKQGVGDLIPPLKFGYAKNPTYNKDAVDIWGLYKSDYNGSLPKNISRLVSGQSASNIDAWSLTEVTTSTGAKIKIEYEPDSYVKPVLYKSFLLNISDIVPTSTQDRVRIMFHNSPSNLSQLINTGSQLNLIGVIWYPFQITGQPLAQYTCDGQALGMWGGPHVPVQYLPNDMVVHLVGADFIEVTCAKLFRDVSLIYGQYPIPAMLPYPKAYPDRPCQVNSQNVNLMVNFNQLPRWDGGNLSFSDNTNSIFGGGLRVSRIRISGQNDVRLTNYQYGNGFTSYEPMGLDKDILVDRSYLVDRNGNTWEAEMKRYKDGTDIFKKNLYGNFSKLLTIAREVPAPGVIYENVTVKEYTEQPVSGQLFELPGSITYEFQVFDEDFIQRIGMTSTQGPIVARCFDENNAFTPCTTRGETPPARCEDQFGNPISCDAQGSWDYTPLTIKDYSAWVGSLKSVSTFSVDGSLISRTSYHFLHDGRTTSQFEAELKNKFNNQGVISQVFNENKTGALVFSRRDDYPLVATGSTVQDFKSNTFTRTENLAFDFFTGNPLRVLQSDNTGNRSVTELTAAYSVPEYSGMTSAQIASQIAGMGLKINNPNNKHMLTQTAQSLTFRVNDQYKTNPINTNIIGLVSASANTWSKDLDVMGSVTPNQIAKQSGIWRSKGSFVFVGDSQSPTTSNGLFNMATFTPFAGWVSNETSNSWQQTSEVTLADPSSHAIEAKDINGNFAATKFTSDHSQVIASAANARYTEFAYCGGEENTTSAGGGVTVNGTRVPTAHTGLFGVQAAVNSRAFSFTLTPTVRDYVVNVWATQPDAFVRFKVGTVTSTATTQRLGKAGNWHLLQATFTATSTQPIEVWVEAKGATTQFDDFRVHPLTGPMTSYVYNSFGELSHILDASNLFSEFRYDAMGRLTQTYRETLLGPGDQPRYGANGIAKVSDIQYNYGKNSPYQVNLTVSQTGGSGSVSPIGSVPVEQGETQTIRIQESCAAPQVRWVYVDNVQYPTNASFTLFDGCSVSITPGSVRLASVRAPHDVRVEFNTWETDVGNRCQMVDIGNNQECPTGLFEYGTRDQCGNITWIPGPWRGPGNAPNCCDLQPIGVNCRCRNVEN